MASLPTISPIYLHDVLRLRTGQSISNVQITDMQTSTTAQIIKFCVRIQDQSGKVTRQRLFLKTAPSGIEQNVYSSQGANEAVFYKQMSTSTGLPIVKCWDTYVSRDATKFLLLLDDISTDYCSADQMALSQSEPWLAAAQSLARLHAHFWDLQRLDRDFVLSQNTFSLQENIRAIHEGYKQFMDYAAKRLSSEILTAYARALEISIELEQRRDQCRVQNRHITLVHGDSHIHNFMFPTRGGGLPQLIDFQFLGAGLGVEDIAHLTRVSFPSVFRRNLHIPILHRYHQELQACGVSDYSWEECLCDYRMAVASMLFVPVWQYVVFHLQYDDWVDGVNSSVESFQFLWREASSNLY